jgi:hypothetical protein
MQSDNSDGATTLSRTASRSYVGYYRPENKTTTHFFILISVTEIKMTIVNTSRHDKYLISGTDHHQA